MKTLRRKDTKEFASYEGSYIGVSQIPTILAETATMEGLKEYHEICLEKRMFLIDPEDEWDWNDYELVDVEILIKD